MNEKEESNMDKFEKAECCPERQKYTISEIYKKYLKCKQSEYFRYELKREGLSERELLDLIEILSINVK